MVITIKHGGDNLTSPDFGNSFLFISSSRAPNESSRVELSYKRIESSRVELNYIRVELRVESSRVELS